MPDEQTDDRASVPGPLLVFFPQQLTISAGQYQPEGDADPLDILQIELEALGFTAHVRLDPDTAEKLAGGLQQAANRLRSARNQSRLIVPPSSEVEAAEKAKIDKSKGKSG